MVAAQTISRSVSTLDAERRTNGSSQTQHSYSGGHEERVQSQGEPFRAPSCSFSIMVSCIHVFQHCIFAEQAEPFKFGSPTGETAAACMIISDTTLSSISLIKSGMLDDQRPGQARVVALKKFGSFLLKPKR